MANMIEKTGKTIEEAIQAAAAELGVTQSDLEVEVMETPTKKFLGLFGSTPAKIRATLKISEPVPPLVDMPAQIEQSAAAQPAEPAKEFEPILEPSPAADESSQAQTLTREQAVDAAEKFLRDVFAAMELEVTIDVTDADEDGFLIDLNGKNLGVLIGRRGQALDALQYLLNLAVNRKLGDEKIHFILDVEDYRLRCEEALTKLAKGVAERAIKTRREVKLEPMNRHERKVIHTVLQGNDRVETHSTGEEPYRCVVVTPVKRGRR